MAAVNCGTPMSTNGSIKDISMQQSVENPKQKRKLMDNISNVYDTNKDLIKQNHLLRNKCQQILTQKNWYKQQLHNLQTRINSIIADNDDALKIQFTPPFTEVNAIDVPSSKDIIIPSQSIDTTTEDGSHSVMNEDDCDNGHIVCPDAVFIKETEFEATPGYCEQCDLHFDGNKGLAIHRGCQHQIKTTKRKKKKQSNILKVVHYDSIEGVNKDTQKCWKCDRSYQHYTRFTQHMRLAHKISMVQ
eukprot:192029_1